MARLRFGGEPPARWSRRRQLCASPGLGAVDTLSLSLWARLVYLGPGVASHFAPWEPFLSRKQLGERTRPQVYETGVEGRGADSGSLQTRNSKAWVRASWGMALPRQRELAGTPSEQTAFFRQDHVLSGFLWIFSHVIY